MHPFTYPATNTWLMTVNNKIHTNLRKKLYPLHTLGVIVVNSTHFSLNLTSMHNNITLFHNSSFSKSCLKLFTPSSTPYPTTDWLHCYTYRVSYRIFHWDGKDHAHFYRLCRLGPCIHIHAHPWLGTCHKSYC